MPAITPDTILDFWFSGAVKPFHFQKNIAFDDTIRERFGSSYEEAFEGKLDDWLLAAKSSLALVIMLDQFPRNMFRNTPQSFGADNKAHAAAKSAINSGFDQELTQEQRVFLYMPFMHSENIEEQERSVELYRMLGIENNVKFAVAHYDIIKRFGRFPHRNDILERDSTCEEIAFLKEPGSGF